MARDDPKFIVRLPPALKASIEAAAHAGGRSMNAEIVSRLEASFGESIAIGTPRGRPLTEAAATAIAVAAADKAMDVLARKLLDMMHSSDDRSEKVRRAAQLISGALSDPTDSPKKKP